MNRPEEKLNRLVISSEIPPPAAQYAALIHPIKPFINHV